MQKRTLRSILIAIVVAISLYQFFDGNENVEPVISESQPAETNTALALPEELSGAEEKPIEATLLPTESTPMAYLEEATGDFDFYVMALSWSPDYCASNGSNDPQQCSIGKKLDFVLHGLWPQYESGCASTLCKILNPPP